MNPLVHKQLTTAVNNSDGRFHAILEASPVPFALNDDNQNIILVNTAFVQTFGYTLQDIPTLADWWPKAYPDESYREWVKATWQQHLEESLRNGTPFRQIELDIRCKDGTVRTAMAGASSIEESRAGIHLVVLYDITERKQAEQVLREDVQRYQALLEAAPFPMVMIDPETRTILYGNHRTELLFDVDGAQVIGRITKDFFVDPQQCDAIVQRVKADAAVYDYEVQLQAASGRRFWALVSSTLSEINGRPTLLTCFNDISERKQAENAIQESHKLLQTVLQTLPVRVFWKDQESRYLGCNALFAADAGLARPEDIIGKTDFDLGWKEHAPAYQADDRQVIEARSPKLAYLERQTTADGRKPWLQTSKVPLLDADNRAVGVLGVYDDITERMLAQEKLVLAARVFGEAHEGILICDAEGTIVDVNPTFCDITGYSREEAIGRNPNLLKSGKQPPEFYASMWSNLVEHGCWQGEVWNRKKDGALYAELLTISALRDDAGRTMHYIGLFSDITQAKHQQQTLELMAHYDVLTRLPNRVLFADRFMQAIARCKRDNALLALCYLDLDGFKGVNDSLGHEAGDQLLIQVAERIQSTLREEDTVSRLGGDEFALLIGKIKTFDQCEQLLERLHHELSQPFLVQRHSVSIGASIGVTVYPLDDADPDTLLRHADQAMYQAKMKGRNRYHLFDAEHDQQMQKQRLMLDKLEQALQRREFTLHYQPKVNMTTGEVIGVEALIRWVHPERGTIPPLEFLPLLEGTHLEIELGNWVIDEALNQADNWRKAGLKMQISVNISPHHLQWTGFTANLEAALARHPALASDGLELEVLESSAVKDMASVSEVLRSCRDKLGVCIALDDFGTGYSSLTHLRRLPANTVKIDRSFVHDMIDDPNDYSITEGVIGLANAFRRTVIAEGVETLEHGLMLINMNCYLAQGYAIAPPMPAEQVIAWASCYQPHAEWQALAGQQLSELESQLMLLKIEGTAWIKRLENCLQSEPSLALQWPIMDQDKCHCGSWIARASKEKLLDQDWLGRIEQAHQRLHETGRTLMQLYQAGKIEEARAGLPALHAGSKVIGSILEQIPRSPAG